MQSPPETYCTVGRQLQRNVRSCEPNHYLSSETSHFNSRNELWIYSGVEVAGGNERCPLTSDSDAKKFIKGAEGRGKQRALQR